MRALRELSRVVDPTILSEKESDRRSHSGDHWPRRLILERGDPEPAPITLVRPRSTEEVAAVVVWAHETSTAVVPYGAGSGVCGAVAPAGGLVVDLSAMNDILDLDERSRLVRAQAGVTGPQLTAYLEERGVTLGHEPQSIAISTVGGWLATRACGQLSARYGGIEDLVAGLAAVTPATGVARAKTVPRRTAGPDVASLLIGSEGTLGIITDATLRVTPIPTERADRCLLFEHLTDGVQACRKLVQSRLEPTVVRLYDRDDNALFMRHETDPPEGNTLILSFDGDGAEDRADAAVSLCGGKTLNARFVEHWWQHRNDAVEEFGALMRGEGLLGPHGVVDTMEVAGTWTVLRDLYHSMKTSLSEKADFVGCHVSHVYTDGACLYFTLGSVASDDEAALAVNDSWWETGMQACLEAGGSISHHHGIGRLKARWLPEELGAWYAALRAVKAALDPKGIMNPGALGL